MACVGRLKHILLYIGGEGGVYRAFRGKQAVLHPVYETLDVTSAAGPPVSLQGLARGMTAEVELLIGPDNVPLPATLAEQMALAVLAGDKVAALALADAIVNGEGGA